ncbi:MAG TPA: hypothetical protein VH008_16530 [Pseudonocardia sp.]|nr:hypothetical protein [Pseudonocardia sp.]
MSGPACVLGTAIYLEAWLRKFGLPDIAVTLGAMFSLAGFDHSATLGREAANPRRAVSVAVLGSVLGCGVLYILATYVIVLVFRDLLYCVLRLRRPAVLDLVGAGDRDDEPVGERA